MTREYDKRISAWEAKMRQSFYDGAAIMAGLRTKITRQAAEIKRLNNLIKEKNNGK